VVLQARELLFIRAEMRLLFVVVALAASACGLDRDIEAKVKIEQGVYGLLIEKCDTAGCTDQPAANADVEVYAAGKNGSYATTKSDLDGIFQIVLPAGDYTLCTSGCTPIAVPAGRVRYDWTSGPGGGRWQRM
jgi:hypothetical protein